MSSFQEKNHWAERQAQLSLWTLPSPLRAGVRAPLPGSCLLVVSTRAQGEREKGDSPFPPSSGVSSGHPACADGVWGPIPRAKERGTRLTLPLDSDAKSWGQDVIKATKHRGLTCFHRASQRMWDTTFSRALKEGVPQTFSHWSGGTRAELPSWGRDGPSPAVCGEGLAFLTRDKETCLVLVCSSGCDRYL